MCTDNVNVSLYIHIYVLRPAEVRGSGEDPTMYICMYVHIHIHTRIYVYIYI